VLYDTTTALVQCVIWYNYSTSTMCYMIQLQH